MKKIIAITGASGTIGTILTTNLHAYNITSLATPETDVSDYDNIVPLIKGADAIIHLAWNTKVENWRSEEIDPTNIQMFFTIYKAALEHGVKRVIMASSVHADRFDRWQGTDKISPAGTPTPDSPYGASKVALEAMGRYYATRGLEVVCVRFGGVNAQNQQPASPPSERAVWLRNEDCVSLIQTILDAETIPDNFVVMYAVSNHHERIHNITNPFGWNPPPSGK